MIEYINSNSVIHDLNPGTKFFFSVAMLFAAIITSSPYFLFFLIILSSIVWFMAEIPLRKFKQVFIVLITLFLVGTLTQAVFFTEQSNYSGIKTVLFYLSPYIPVTMEGIRYGIIFSMRMMVIFMPPILIPLTSHPSEIVLMLRKMKFPEWLILLITMSIRFLPLTMKNFTTLRNAQRLRKTKLEFQDLLFLFESLIITSLKTAKQMALALEVKAFGHSERRTSFRTLEFSFKDSIFFTLSILIIVAAVFNRGV